MQAIKIDGLTIENIDKNTYLNKQIVKAFIKKNIENLTDYTPGEENLLISLATGLTYTQLILFKAFDKGLLRRIKKFLKLRLEHMPLNKIAKKVNFYLDEFYINNFVLAPRKETELLVEKVIKQTEKEDKESLKILDLCCGSGAIGLTLAKYIKKPCMVTLADISLKALKVTKKNQEQLEVESNTILVKSNMFRDLKKEDKFDIIVSNPPYIKTGDLVNLDLSVKKYDPVLALNGGSDGLKFYKAIAKSVKDYLTKNGFVFLEIGFDQAESVKKLFEKDFDVKIYKDYSDNDRMVVAQLK